MLFANCASARKQAINSCIWKCKPCTFTAIAQKHHCFTLQCPNWSFVNYFLKKLGCSVRVSRSKYIVECCGRAVLGHRPDCRPRPRLAADGGVARTAVPPWHPHTPPAQRRRRRRGGRKVDAWAGAAAVAAVASAAVASAVASASAAAPALRPAPPGLGQGQVGGGRGGGGGV